MAAVDVDQEVHESSKNPYSASISAAEELGNYRTVSRSAIASVVVFLLGLTVSWCRLLLILPLAGLLLGLFRLADDPALSH